MLTKSELQNILADWSFWDKNPKKTIQRSVLSKPIHLDPDLPLIIQGVRRGGKSTILPQIMEQQNRPHERSIFVNFEDPRLTENLNHNLLDAILEATRARLGNLEHCVFFFDEIQEVKGWERWFHARLERPLSASFVITGSSASLLAGELATVLTGRHRTLELSPFNFEEYKKIKPDGDFDSWMFEGGFPRALIDSEPAEILRGYFTQIIERDVRRHVAARSTAPLIRLIKTVYESTGSDLSLRSLAQTLDVTPDTIKVWLDACQQAYLVLACPFFTWSEKQRSARSHKYYPIDLGLRGAVVTKTGGDFGKRLETVVFHALRKRFQSVYYWKGKGEVDFVTQDTSGITPWQVTWDAPQERHEKALKEFKTAYPESNAPRFINRSNVEQFFSE